MHPQRSLMACLPIALVLLSGCAAERSPASAPLPPLGIASPAAAPTPSATPSSAPPGASASPTVQTPVAVDVPAPARANTPQAAGAFVRFYFDELLKASISLDTRRVKFLAADSCRTCAGLTSGFEVMRVQNEKLSGAPLVIEGAEAPGFGYGPVVVDLYYSIPQYDLLDAQGKIIKRFEAVGSSTFLVTLMRRSSNWQILEIQVP